MLAIPFLKKTLLSSKLYGRIVIVNYWSLYSLLTNYKKEKKAKMLLLS